MRALLRFCVAGLLALSWLASPVVCQETAAAFGFTPAARSRIPKSGATGKSDNPFAAHLQNAS